MTKIYVGNLSFGATEYDLREAFEVYGEVSAVNIIIDRETGRSRGFAFVEMSNREDAHAAIRALNGAEIGGRILSVNEARARADKPASGGRVGGTGGGGRHSDSSPGDGPRQAFKAAGPKKSHYPLRVELFVRSFNNDDESDQISFLRSEILKALDSIGFELDPGVDPEEEFGSWWARLLFRSKQAISSDEMIDIYTETREALRRKAIDEVGADVFGKRADAIEKLLARLSQFDEAAFRLGDVLIVKATVSGKVRVVVETMSHQLQRALDENPMLIRDPASLLTRIEGSNTSISQTSKRQDITKR